VPWEHNGAVPGSSKASGPCLDGPSGTSWSDPETTLRPLAWVTSQRHKVRFGSDAGAYRFEDALSTTRVTVVGRKARGLAYSCRTVLPYDCFIDRAALELLRVVRIDRDSDVRFRPEADLSLSGQTFLQTPLTISGSPPLWTS
jgi:hypothetical protein